MPASPFVLYRFYSERGELLYVGLTSNPARRFEKHRGDKSWWDHVSRIDLEHYPTREALRQAERIAIEAEKPLHNIRMNIKDLLVWTCEECGQAIADDDGYITISYGEIGYYKRAVKEWEAEHVADHGAFRSYDATSVLTHPKHPNWQILHRSCDPNLERGDDYWIPVERIRTPDELIHWTAHLLGKNWIQLTDWDRLLREITADVRL